MCFDSDHVDGCYCCWFSCFIGKSVFILLQFDTFCAEIVQIFLLSGKNSYNKMLAGWLLQHLQTGAGVNCVSLSTKLENRKWIFRENMLLVGLEQKMEKEEEEKRHLVLAPSSSPHSFADIFSKLQSTYYLLYWRCLPAYVFFKQPTLSFFLHNKGGIAWKLSEMCFVNKAE